jgi:hypothetical protein
MSYYNRQSSTSSCFSQTSTSSSSYSSSSSSGNYVKPTPEELEKRNSARSRSVAVANPRSVPDISTDGYKRVHIECRVQSFSAFLDIGVYSPDMSGINIQHLPLGFIENHLKTQAFLSKTLESPSEQDIYRHLRRYVCLATLPGPVLTEAGFDKVPTYPVIFSRRECSYEPIAGEEPILSPIDENGNDTICYPPVLKRMVNQVPTYHFRKCGMTSLTLESFLSCAFPSFGRDWCNYLSFHEEGEWYKTYLPLLAMDAAISASVVYGHQSITSSFCKNDGYTLFWLSKDNKPKPYNQLPPKICLVVPPSFEEVIAEHPYLSTIPSVDGTEFGFVDIETDIFFHFYLRKSKSAPRFIRAAGATIKAVPDMLGDVTLSIVREHFFKVNFSPHSNCEVHGISGRTVDASPRYLIFEPGMGITSVGFSQNVFSALVIMCSSNVDVQLKVAFELIGRMMFPYIPGFDVGSAVNWAFPSVDSKNMSHPFIPLYLMWINFKDPSCDGNKKMNLPDLWYDEAKNRAFVRYLTSRGKEGRPGHVSSDYESYNTGNSYWDTVLTTLVLLKIVKAGLVPLPTHVRVLETFLGVLCQLRADILHHTNKTNRLRDMFCGIEAKRKNVTKKPNQYVKPDSRIPESAKYLYFIKSTPSDSPNAAPFSTRERLPSGKSVLFRPIQVEEKERGFGQWRKNEHPKDYIPTYLKGYALMTDDLNRFQEAVIGTRYRAGASQIIEYDEPSRKYDWNISRGPFYWETDGRYVPAVSIPSDIKIEGDYAISRTLYAYPSNAMMKGDNCMFSDKDFIYTSEKG